MSPRQEPAAPSPEDESAHVEPTSETPDLDELAKTAVPATYRRAPRADRFVLTGVGMGAVVGIVVGILLPGSTVGGRTVVALLVGLAGALVGGLASATQVAMFEVGSGRSADRQKSAIQAQWAPVHPDATKPSTTVPSTTMPSTTAPSQTTPSTSEASGDADGSR